MGHRGAWMWGGNDAMHMWTLWALWWVSGSHTSWPHGEHVRTPDWLGTGTETFSSRRRQQSRQLRCVFSRDSTPSGEFNSLAQRGLEQHVLCRAALEGIVGSLGATACGRKVCARSPVFDAVCWGELLCGHGSECQPKVLAMSSSKLTSWILRYSIPQVGKVWQLKRNSMSSWPQKISSLLDQTRPSRQKAWNMWTFHKIREVQKK